MTINLIGRVGPLEPIAFPNGHECAVRRLDADGYRLLHAMRENVCDATVLALLQWIVPDATADDWATLDEHGVMATAILGHATGKLDTALALAKNAVAGAAQTATATPADRPRPSNPRTKSTTSSRGSRKRSARTS